MTARQTVQAPLDIFLHANDLSQSSPPRKARQNPGRGAGGEKVVAERDAPQTAHAAAIESLVASLPRVVLEDLLRNAVQSGTAVTRNDIEEAAEALRRSNFQLLPDEILIMILKFLSLRGRIKMLRCVSRRLRALPSDPLWRHFRFLYPEPEWISSHGLFRLLTDVIPVDSIRAFKLSVGVAGVIDPAHLPLVLARQRKLIELHIHGSYTKESLFHAAPSLADLRVLTLCGHYSKHSPESPAALSSFLAKMENLESFSCDSTIPAILLVPSPSFAIHRTLRMLQLGSNAVDAQLVLRLLEVCTGLKELAISVLSYSWTVVESDDIAPNERPFRDVVVPDQIRGRVQERKSVPGGFARLDTLTIEGINFGGNYSADYNIRSFAPIAEFVGDDLRSLRVGNRYCIAGDFPNLEELCLNCGCVSGDQGRAFQDYQMVRQAAENQVEGFRAPNLRTLHHPKLYTGMYWKSLHGSFQEQYWYELRRVVGCDAAKEITCEALVDCCYEWGV